MIYIVVCSLVIALLVLYVYHQSYVLSMNEGKEKIEKEWKEKNEQLHSWEKDLKSRYAQLEQAKTKFEQEKNAIFQGISDKKTDMIKKYDHALSGIKIAEKI